MKEKWHNIDELNEELGQSLDLDASWNAFGKKKKKRRPFFIWFFGGLLLLLFSYFALDFVSSERVLLSEVETKELISEIPKANTTATNEIGESIKDENLETRIVTQNNEKASLIEPKENSKIKKENLAGQALVTKDVKNVINESMPKIQKEKVFELTEKVAESQSNSPTREIENSVVTLSAIDKTKKNLLKVKQKSKQSDNKFLNEQIQKEQIVLVETLEIQPFELVFNNQVIEPLVDVARTPASEKPVKNKQPLYMSIAYGYSNPSRQIKNADSYHERRLMHEEVKESQQLEFLMTKKLSRKFSLSSGMSIDMTRVRSEEVILEIETLELPNQVIAENFKDGIKVSEDIGPLSSTKMNQTKYIRYQRYGNIRVPVMLGIDILNNDKWAVQLNAGIQLQVWGQVNGEVIDSKLPNGIYKPLSSLEYRKFGHLKGRGMLSLTRKLSNDLSLFAGIKYDSDINSRQVSNSNLQERFIDLGVQIGIRKGI